MGDLDRTLSDQDKLIMAETILAWADLDTGISRLTLLIFGLNEDAGSILVGGMDLKTKVERIKQLHDHHGLSETAAKFKRLASAMVDHSVCRNTIAHRKCVGRLISQPGRLAFLSARHVKGVPNQFEVVCVDHSEMVASAQFARSNAVKVGELIEGIESRGQGSDG